MLTLYIRNFSLFTRRFQPNHWAARGPRTVLHFSLVMKRFELGATLDEALGAVISSSPAGAQELDNSPSHLTPKGCPHIRVRSTECVFFIGNADDDQPFSRGYLHR